MCDMNERLSRMMRTFGPGIMFASTAIGVSHLVQSTRAGAEFGFGLVAIVLLANILKYPFFEFSSRYANATGTSLIDGYKKHGCYCYDKVETKCQRPSFLYPSIRLVPVAFAYRELNSKNGYFKILAKSTIATRPNPNSAPALVDCTR